MSDPNVIILVNDGDNLFMYTQGNPKVRLVYVDSDRATGTPQGRLKVISPQLDEISEDEALAWGKAEFEALVDAGLLEESRAKAAAAAAS